MPTRIQRKRTKGWRMPPDTVSVTRPGPWGNIYTIAGARADDYQGTDRELAKVCVSLFETAWRDAVRIAERDHAPLIPFGKPVYVGPLIGKNLACFCRLCPEHKDGKPFDVDCPECMPCHADPLGLIVRRFECQASR